MGGLRIRDREDATSTILKFFLPILLIIVVALSSLMLKLSSRLGLNASMFLAAVLIHWRVADGIPLVAYATFLDLFMIITYATLVMVLVSDILILKVHRNKRSGSYRTGQPMVYPDHTDHFLDPILSALPLALGLADNNDLVGMIPVSNIEIGIKRAAWPSP